MSELRRETDRRSTLDTALDSRTNPATSRISSRTGLKRDDSTGLVIRGGDGASIGDYLDKPRNLDDETIDLYGADGNLYNGKGILPGKQTTRPTERKVKLKPYDHTASLERITDLYNVDRQGKLQPTKTGFNKFMKNKLYEACLSYFSNVGKPAETNDGAYLTQRNAMNKKSGYNLTDLTSTFYDVTKGALKASKQGFSAYLNLFMTNAAFQYFDNVGKKAPAGYIAGKSAPSPARYLPGKK